MEYAIKPVVQPPCKYIADKHFQRHGVILPENQNNLLQDAVKNGRNTLQSKK
jgi:hypothetical protein